MDVTRKRTQKITNVQINIILDFISDHKLMFSRNMNPNSNMNPSKVKQIEKLWEMLADSLNKCTDGPKKSGKLWKRTFVEWKSKAKNRIKFKLSQGNRNEPKSLTHLEHRLLILEEDCSKYQQKMSANCTLMFDDDSDQSLDKKKLTPTLEEDFNELQKDISELGSDDNRDQDSNTKKRTPKISNFQMKLMLDFMSKNRIMMGGYTNSTRMNEINKLWISLSDILNCANSGPKKPPDGWKKAFIEWKSKVERKAKDISMNDNNYLENLSVPENKLLTLLDFKYSSKQLNNCAPKKQITVEDPLFIAGDKVSDLVDVKYEKSKCEINKLLMKKKRTTKMSPSQLNIMLDFMSENKIMLNKTQSRTMEVEILWNSLTNSLNKCKSGSKKSKELWKKAFTEWKSKVRNRINNLKQNENSSRPLTYFENKLCALLEPSNEANKEICESETNSHTVQDIESQNLIILSDNWDNASFNDFMEASKSPDTESLHMEKNTESDCSKLSLDLEYTNEEFQIEKPDLTKNDCSKNDMKKQHKNVIRKIKCFRKKSSLAIMMKRFALSTKNLCTSMNKLSDSIMKLTEANVTLAKNIKILEK